MKGKKLWAIILTICMIVSSIGIISVMAGEQTDATLSVSVTDEDGNPVSYLKAGDVITVAVNLDSFKSVTIKDDESTTDSNGKNKKYGNKVIHTIGFSVPYDSTYFEPVLDEDGEPIIEIGAAKYINAKAINLDTNEHAALVATADGDIEETTTGGEIVTFQLKVKDTLTADANVSFNVTDIILKNMYLEETQLYAVSVNPASVTLQVPPTVKVNDSTTVAATYQTAVTVAATSGAAITVNGEKSTNPCTIKEAGEYKVVATNESGCTTEKTFKIAPVVDSITIKSAPATTEYVKGSALDLTGGVITATYTNGETKDVDMTSEMITGFDGNTAGEQTLTITYEGKTATFKVTVKNREVSELAWAQEPAADIIQGQDLNVALDGAKIKVTYASGTPATEEIAVTKAMCSGYDETTAVGNHTVTVTYGGKTLTFDLNVKAKTLTGIAVATNPTKTTYLEGKDALDLTGGTISLTYDNGIAVDPIAMTAEGVTVTGYNKDKVGEQTLTVAYGEQTAQFKVNVKAKTLTAIAVQTKPTKITYLEGKDDLELAGGTISLTYDNGIAVDPIAMTAEGVEVTGFDNKKTGAQTLKVTYGGQETSFDITIQAKSVQEVKLLSAPTQTTVKEGKKLDLAGAKVQVVYDNGTTDDVDVTEDMISGLDTATPGTYDVTVTYNNKKADTKFKITVEPKKVSAVQLNTSTLVTEVKEGKTYTPAGKLTVSYDNDTTEVVSFSDASVTVDSSAVDTATPGEYTVKVSYTNGETYTLTYTVKVVDKILTGISVTTNPKTSYIEGNALDLSEGVITLSYDNDTTATLAMTAEGVVVSGYDNTKVGSQTLKVTYGTQETALDVVVAAKQISNVEIISYPLATTVLEALEFDVTGGKLKVSYDNDTTEEIAVTQAMLKLDTNKVGEQEAQIEYAGRTFGFNVTVIPKSPISITAAIPSDEIVEGTELADAGLNVFLNYDNGTSDNLVLSTVGITGYDNNTLGSQTVKLSYVVDEETTFETELIVYVLKGSDTDLSIETNDTDQNKYVVSNQTVTEEVKTIVKELVTTVISTVKNYDVVDFTMYIKETGAVTQPDGTVAVTISIAKVLPNFNTANKVSVYRLDDDKLVLMKSTRNGDTLTFETDHFTPFVFIEEEVQAEEPSTTVESTTEETKAQETTNTTETATNTPKTGDSTNTIIFFAAVALVGAGIVTVSRKKEQM